MIDTNIVRLENKRIDELEATMIDFMEPIVVPVKHLFTNGMYIREVTIPAGSLLTSKIHKTEHPFTISKGKVMVMADGDWTELTAPYTGITKAGTRRIVLVLEDCVWTTYHKYNGLKGTENDLTLAQQDKIADRIEARIIQKHHNRLINRRKSIWHG